MKVRQLLRVAARPLASWRAQPAAASCVGRLIGARCRSDFAPQGHAAHQEDPYASRGDPYAQQGSEDPYAPRRRGSDDPYAPRPNSRFGGGGGYGGGDRYGGGGGGFGGGGDRYGAGGDRYGGGGDRYGGGGDRYRGGDRYGGGGQYGGEQRGAFDGPFGQRGGDRSVHGAGMPDRMGTVGQNLRQLDWSHETLIDFDKNFYHEHPEVEAMSEQQVQALMQKLNATVEGKKPHPKPLQNWDYLQLPEGIKQVVTASGFERPTPIQSVGWPAALSGRDMVGIAQTGSGKTLAYALPALVHISAQPPLRPGDGPIGLVMAPTRELAMQIQAEIMKFTRSTGIRCTAVFGGVSRYGQASDLRRGCEIVVATPGRLLDFLEAGVTNLKRVTYLALDEADRMLDMGFEPQIRKVVSQIRPDRQTLMWSATWPKEIQRLARDFCREDPIKLTIGTEELSSNPDITQQIEVVSEYEKRERFMNWIRGATTENQKVLIFTETKRGADSLCRELQYQQMSAAAIHGDKDQRQRDRTLFEFKSGRVNVLIATDVAQRGLDIKDVAYVVNYDVPKTMEDYIHRIGRTGRAGAKGTAVTYFPAEAYTPDMIRMARNICKSMREVGQLPPQELLNMTGGGRR